MTADTPSCDSEDKVVDREDSHKDAENTDDESSRTGTEQDELLKEGQESGSEDGDVRGSDGEHEDPGPEELAQMYLDNWRRTQADFENYKKRMVKEKEILAQSIREDVLYRLLPSIDHLD